MKRKELLKCVKLLLAGFFLTLTAVQAFAAQGTGIDSNTGRAYFEGSKRFLNAGPACISCHNVTHNAVAPGGLLAKDLTDVYERLGEGITVWLDAPPFPAMITSYQDHPLTETERTALTAFFKDINDKKKSQKAKSGYEIFYFGGGGGLVVILILIGLHWVRRKRHTVKKEIFARQSKAWDAKF